MDFYRLFQHMPPNPDVDGLIRYYCLTDWWMSAFTQVEREYIEATYQPTGALPGSRPLTQGHVESTSHSRLDFLAELRSWFLTDDVDSMDWKIQFFILGQMAVSGPGYFLGRHYSTYGYDVIRLKRIGDGDAVERLLLALVDAAEAERRAKGRGVASWPYMELAKLYHRRTDNAAEVAILERFMHEWHAPSMLPPRLLTRLEKARALLAGSQDKETT
jgi:hypothetical protein